MILCDIGNTTFHFKTPKESFKIGTKESLKDLSNYKKDIYFISVNKKATKKLLDKYPKAINIENSIKFETSYEGMGIDRQMVCSYIKNGIIVDIGSAITVDIMKEGKHKGGFILPGIEAYKRIYPNISKKLSFDFKKDINLDKIPLKTNDAINYAIFNSIALPIMKEYKKYKLKVYFTGGDKSIIKKYFKDIPSLYKKNLIFNSMEKYINKMIKKEN
ncbi:MAG: type III pantothenate kinase [Campylobacterota bacterium]|nr:type III pantothenate kinase [Campylobacterota bacterium]